MSTSERAPAEAERERVTGRKAPRQERSRLIVGSLVKATIDLLATGANAGFSMRELAQRAGVGIGSIYDYFADRYEVLDAVVDHLTRENFERLRSGFERASRVSLETGLSTVLDETFAIYLDSGALTRSAVRTIMRFGRSEHVVAQRDRFLEHVAERIRLELPGLDPDELRFRLQTTTDMVFGVVLAELCRPGDPRRLEVARRMARAAVFDELARLRAESRRAEPERGPGADGQVTGTTDE